jgi:hypothetical protein
VQQLLRTLQLLLLGAAAAVQQQLLRQAQPALQEEL